MLPVDEFVALPVVGEVHEVVVGELHAGAGALWNVGARHETHSSAGVLHPLGQPEIKDFQMLGLQRAQNLQRALILAADKNATSPPALGRLKAAPTCESPKPETPERRPSMAAIASSIDVEML